jgi:hypothetical protein
MERKAMSDDYDEDTSDRMSLSLYKLVIHLIDFDFPSILQANDEGAEQRLRAQNIVDSLIRRLSEYQNC